MKTWKVYNIQQLFADADVLIDPLISSIMGIKRRNQREAALSAFSYLKMSIYN
jgi:hypothetical protein